MTKFPRVPVEIDLGEGPIQTHFRLTNFAVASLKEQMGAEALAAFGDREKIEALSPTERVVMDATLMWALLLHEHPKVTIRDVLDNLPVNQDEYMAIAGKAVEAMSKGQPPANPMTGPRSKSAPKKAVNGGIEKLTGEPSSKSNAESQQMSITN